jgi:UDP-hydrolysing UDP-N-acetyl-D-glucosamine 2-epimerase
MTSRRKTGKKRTICVITGNQADYTRFRSLMRAISEYPNLKLQTIVTGAHLLMRHGHTVDQILKDGFRVDERIHQIVEGEGPVSMARSIGLGICDLSTTLDRLRPDVVFVTGDRFEALSAAVAASVMNFHVAHIQGGEVTGSIDESIRHAITKLSHIHFPSTESARARVISLGEDPNYVFNVGCPGTDLVLETKILDRKGLDRAIAAMTKGDAISQNSQPFLLMFQHPVTTQFEDQKNQILSTLEAVRRTKIMVICLWPNVDAGSERIVQEIRRSIRTSQTNGRFLSLSRLSPDLFINLIKHTTCMVGNSSSGIRESCYTGTPVVNVGIRQQGRERGRNVIDAPNDADSIHEAILRQLKNGPYQPDPIYGDGHAGKKMAAIISELDLPGIQKAIRY